MYNDDIEQNTTEKYDQYTYEEEYLSYYESDEVEDLYENY